METKTPVSELELRRRVYDTVSKCPGLEFRDLQARTKLNMGQLRTCLNFLEEHKLISQKEDQTHFRFFAQDGMSEKEKRIMLLLRQSALRGVVIFLLEHPMSRSTILEKELHLSSSELTHYVTQLVTAGVLRTVKKGFSTFLDIEDPQLVYKLLVTYKESFLDKLVDKFIDSWVIR